MCRLGIAQGRNRNGACAGNTEDVRWSLRSYGSQENFEELEVIEAQRTKRMQKQDSKKPKGLLKTLRRKVSKSAICPFPDSR